VSPYSDTANAFIRDFAPDYSSYTTATTPLASGQPFNISLQTTAGDHIQYGFEMIGPNTSTNNVTNLGELLIAAPPPVNVTVDPSQSWIGYMNWSPVPTDAPGYGGTGGNSWGTSDLDASFSAGVVTFSPNTSISQTIPLPNPYWWNADGSGANNMDANFYVQNDNLAGDIVSFSGYCWTNTLVPPYSTNVTAFIKDFSPSYATFTTAVAPLVSDQPFSLNLSTAAGDHIQYGFEMIGPDASITNAAALGEVLIDSNPPPSGPAITSLLPANPVVFVGSNEVFTAVATGGGLNYQWQQNGVNLTNNANVSGATTAMLTLNNVQGGAEATYTVVVYNTSGTNKGSTYLTVLNPAHLTVDPTAPWVGYENWFYNNGGVEGPLVGQSEEAPSHLPATFHGAVLTLAPNTSDYNPANPEFVNGDGSAAALVEADFYVQEDALAGLTLTFVGYCPSNSLAAGYTTTAFIEDFVPSYGSFTSADTNLISGEPFSLTLATTAGDHIEYGFKTVGPVANPTNVASLGQALASINPPTTTASVTGSGSGFSLSFPTESGLVYTVQYKNNLTDAAWQTLTAVNGTGSTVTITDSAAPTHRFYRLSIQ
jgi:hypothetical protein